jgi:hypothetical protein
VTCVELRRCSEIAIGAPPAAAWGNPRCSPVEPVMEDSDGMPMDPCWGCLAASCVTLSFENRRPVYWFALFWIDMGDHLGWDCLLWLLVGAHGSRGDLEPHRTEEPSSATAVQSGWSRLMLQIVIHGMHFCCTRLLFTCLNPVIPGVGSWQCLSQ